MKTNLSFRLHLAVWCVAVLLMLIPVISHKPAEMITGTVIAALFWMGVYYLFNKYLCPVLLLEKKLTAFFGISILILLALPFIGYSLLFLSKAIFEGSFSDFYQGYGLAMHISGGKALLQAALFGSFFRMITEYYENEKM